MKSTTGSCVKAERYMASLNFKYEYMEIQKEVSLSLNVFKLPLALSGDVIVLNASLI